jgi:hypothetical protein
MSTLKEMKRKRSLFTNERKSKRGSSEEKDKLKCSMPDEKGQKRSAGIYER